MESSIPSDTVFKLALFKFFFQSRRALSVNQGTRKKLLNETTIGIKVLLRNPKRKVALGKSLNVVFFRILCLFRWSILRRLHKGSSSLSVSQLILQRPGPSTTTILLHSRSYYLRTGWVRCQAASRRWSIGVT